MIGKSFSSIPAGAYLSVPEVTQRVISVISSVKSAPSKVSAESHFVADLHFDSILRKNLNQDLFAEFCIAQKKDEEPLLSVPEAVSFFAQHPKARW